MKLKFFALFLMITILWLDSFAQPAADFTITNTEDQVVSLYADYLNQGKTVVLDIFFTTCPPCKTAAPLIEPLYQEWGGGDYDVEFIALSIQGFDSNSDVLDYAYTFGHTYPGAGQDGGAIVALTAYTNGTYGNFLGTPTFVVIAPDGSVNYDIRAPGPGYQNTMDEIDAAIAATGAEKPSAPVFNYGGIIQSENNPIDSVYIKIDDCITPIDIVDPSHETYAEDGEFMFALSSPAQGGSCLYPEKLDGLLDGVSTIDILFIRRHMLDIAYLTPEELMYKADINNDGKVSTIDIVHLRRAILAHTDEFPDNTSWRFDSETSFQVDPGSSGPYDFEAYKVGDVNGDLFDDSSLRTTSKWEYGVSQSEGKSTLSVYPGDRMQTAGFQFCLTEIPSDAIIHCPLADFTNANYHIAGNSLYISYEAPLSVMLYNDQPLFEIEFERSSGSVEPWLNRSLLTPEIYSHEGLVQPLELNKKRPGKTSVFPNPASHELTISYFMEDHGEVLLELLNASGERVLGKTVTGRTGNNRQSFSTNSLEPGVYFLRRTAFSISDTHPVVILPH